jgi:hypothetical protein
MLFRAQELLLWQRSTAAPQTDAFFSAPEIIL